MMKEEDKIQGFTIRPKIEKRFNSVVVRETLKSVIFEELDGKKYNSFCVSKMMDHLGKLVLEKLKEFPYEGYKYVLNFMIAERKGQALRWCSACHWDSDTDDVATEFIITEHLICAAMVHAVYFY